MVRIVRRDKGVTRTNDKVELGAIVGMFNRLRFIDGFRVVGIVVKILCEHITACPVRRSKELWRLGRVVIGVILTNGVEVTHVHGMRRKVWIV